MDGDNRFPHTSVMQRGEWMNEVSPYISGRIGANAKHELEGELYQELANRLGELRETTGIQIEIAKWTAWVVPVVTVALILGTYFFWLVPQY